VGILNKVLLKLYVVGGDNILEGNMVGEDNLVGEIQSGRGGKVNMQYPLYLKRETTWWNGLNIEG